MPAAKVTGCESRLLCFGNVLVTTYPLATAKIDLNLVPNEGEAFAGRHEREVVAE